MYMRWEREREREVRTIVEGGDEITTIHVIKRDALDFSAVSKRQRWDLARPSAAILLVHLECENSPGEALACEELGVAIRDIALRRAGRHQEAVGEVEAVGRQFLPKSA